MHARVLDIMHQKYKQINCDDKLREMATKCHEIVKNGPAPFNLILMSYLYYPKYRPFPWEDEKQSQPGEKVVVGKQEMKIKAQPDGEIAEEKQDTKIETQPNGDVAEETQDTKIEVEPDKKVIVEKQNAKIDGEPDVEVVVALSFSDDIPSSGKEVIPPSPEVQAYRDQFLTMAQSTRKLTIDISSIIKESNNYLKEIRSVSKLRLISCLGILTRVELNAKLYELYLKQIQNTNSLSDILRGGLFSPLSADINKLGVEVILDQIHPLNYKEPLIEITESNLNTYQLERTSSVVCAKSLCRFKKLGKICLSGAVIAVLATTAYKIAKRSSRLLENE